jgi:hypothetical protein
MGHRINIDYTLTRNRMWAYIFRQAFMTNLSRRMDERLAFKSAINVELAFIRTIDRGGDSNLLEEMSVSWLPYALRD